MILVKKVAGLVTIVILLWMLLPGCAPAQRPADDDQLPDRTYSPNDMYNPKRTGNRWNDWMGRERVNPMDVDNDGIMDNNIGRNRQGDFQRYSGVYRDEPPVNDDNDGVLGDSVDRRPPGTTR